MRKRLKSGAGIRELTGMSQAEMAAMLGISREALALYETGKRTLLPGNAHAFLGWLVAELNKPANHPGSTPAVIPEKHRDNLRKKLEHIAREKRYKAMGVQMQLDKMIHRQELVQKRRCLLPCIEKVHAILLEQSKGSPWQPLTEHHQRWLQRAKELNGFCHSEEEHFVKQQLLRLKYKMLVLEAEEADRMNGKVVNGEW